MEVKIYKGVITSTRYPKTVGVNFDSINTICETMENSISTGRIDKSKLRSLFNTRRVGRRVYSVETRYRFFKVTGINDIVPGKQVTLRGDIRVGKCCISSVEIHNNVGSDIFIVFQKHNHKQYSDALLTPTLMLQGEYNEYERYSVNNFGYVLMPMEVCDAFGLAKALFKGVYKQAPYNFNYGKLLSVINEINNNLLTTTEISPPPRFLSSSRETKLYCGPVGCCLSGLTRTKLNTVKYDLKYILGTIKKVPQEIRMSI